MSDASAPKQQALTATLPTLPGRSVVVTYNLEARVVSLRVATSNNEAAVLETSATVTLTHGESAALASAISAMLGEIAKRRQTTAETVEKVQGDAEKGVLGRTSA